MKGKAADHNLFRASPDMCVDDAVCALIVLEDGRYLMQMRDDRPGVFFPGHWGLFGGAVERGETPEEALQRELAEELHFQPTAYTYFSRMDIDYGSVGDIVRYRQFYEIRISEVERRRLVLGEGREIGAFAAPDLLLTLPVVPYDAFPIWLHYMRDQLVSNHAARRGKNE